MSFLKKIIFRNENVKAPCFVRDKHGTITTSINNSLSSLLEHHFPHGSNSAGFPLPVVTDLQSVSIPHYDWLSVDRIQKAFSSFSDNNNTGPDKIKPIILKNLPDSALPCLSKIFSASIFLGYTPSPWRISRIIFIPKWLRLIYWLWFFWSYLSYVIQFQNSGEACPLGNWKHCP